MSYVEIYNERLHDLLQPYKPNARLDPQVIFQLFTPSCIRLEPYSSALCCTLTIRVSPPEDCETSVVMLVLASLYTTQILALGCTQAEGWSGGEGEARADVCARGIVSPS